MVAFGKITGVQYASCVPLNQAELGYLKAGEQSARQHTNTFAPAPQQESGRLMG